MPPETRDRISARDSAVMRLSRPISSSGPQGLMPTSEARVTWPGPSCPTAAVSGAYNPSMAITSRMMVEVLIVLSSLMGL